ncbi:MAG TPA: peptidase M15, partial [Alphaproteobacteria bacterium]|nr:peptidase M15 [Alphaproteobacteria bacterium]
FDGAHTIGAFDVVESYVNAYRLMKMAFLVGFTGIGVLQHGDPKKRMIHLDRVEVPHITRPRIWTYCKGEK